MIVKMSDFGASLCTRVAGRKAYDEIMASTGSLSSPTVFDFSGVETITNSFSDEVFGRMVLGIGMDAMRSVTSFRNVDRFMAMVIRRSMDAREAQREVIPA